MRRDAAPTSPDRDQLLADAHALQRLTAYPEWAVFERVLEAHVDRITSELCQRGLDHVATECLRVELAKLEWVRTLPAALQHAVDDHEALAAHEAAMAATSPQIVAGPEPFATWYRDQSGGPR
jgi:hypothetical protein